VLGGTSTSLSEGCGLSIGSSAVGFVIEGAWVRVVLVVLVLVLVLVLVGSSNIAVCIV